MSIERAPAERSARVAAQSLVDAPPALQDYAAAIRARLGPWSALARPWRIISGPGWPGAAVAGDGDLIVRIDAHTAAAESAAWLAGGAALLLVEGADASLHCGGVHYRLTGRPASQWLAALAAFLECGFAPHDALCLAWGWRAAVAGEPAGHDWPSDPAHMPRVVGLPEPAAGTPAYPPCPTELGLYPVVPNADWVERLLGLGVATVQLRIKAEPDGDVNRLAREIRRAVAAGQAHGARVFINDHWQLALEAGAYGVHLGQEDLQLADLEALARAGVRLGLSTHGFYEMLVAWHFRPSYLAFGAVFPTRTKHLATDPQGLARLARFTGLFAGHVSTVAIGGIDLALLPQVLATGVGSAAVVSAVTGAADPAAAVAAFQQAFQGRRA